MLNTFLDIETLKIGDWLTLISFFTGLISGILGILFYRWGVKQQETASRMVVDIQIKMSETLHNIRENINGINKVQERINEPMLNALIQQFSRLTEDKLINRLNQEHPILISNEASKGIGREVALETQKEIKNFYKSLSFLNSSDLGVLYAIWISNQIHIDEIKRITSYEDDIINKSLNKLRKNEIITEIGNISPEANLLLEDIFNIDFYSGMSFSEKINAIYEIVERANKITT